MNSVMPHCRKKHHYKKHLKIWSPPLTKGKRVVVMHRNSQLWFDLVFSLPPSHTSPSGAGPPVRKHQHVCYWSMENIQLLNPKRLLGSHTPPRACPTLAVSAAKLTPQTPTAQSIVFPHRTSDPSYLWKQSAAYQLLLLALCFLIRTICLTLDTALVGFGFRSTLILLVLEHLLLLIMICYILKFSKQQKES